MKNKEKNKTKSEKQKIAQKLSSAMRIPYDIAADGVHITLNDNKEISIENYKGIIAYDPDKIDLAAKHHIIVIRGKNLKIEFITDEDVSINGEILSVSFQKE